MLFFRAASPGCKLQVTGCKSITKPAVNLQLSTRNLQPLRKRTRLRLCRTGNAGAKLLVLVGFLALVGWAVTGCGRGVNAAASGEKAFQSAPPETKAAWETAMAAAKSNDFAVALLTLGRLGTEAGLTPEQAQAVKQAAAALTDQMYAAANKGDSNGLRAIQELRKARAR